MMYSFVDTTQSTCMAKHSYSKQMLRGKCDCLCIDDVIFISIVDRACLIFMFEGKITV